MLLLAALLFGLIGMHHLLANPVDPGGSHAGGGVAAEAAVAGHHGDQQVHAFGSHHAPPSPDPQSGEPVDPGASGVSGDTGSSGSSGASEFFEPSGSSESSGHDRHGHHGDHLGHLCLAVLVAAGMAVLGWRMAGRRWYPAPPRAKAAPPATRRIRSLPVPSGPGSFSYSLCVLRL